MRKLFSILNLLLCFELIVAPIAPNLSLFSAKAHAQSSCPAGLYMDTILNRCLTSVQSANILNATANCDVDDHACYRSNAEELLQKDVTDGKVDDKATYGRFGSSITNAAAMSGAVVFGVGLLSKSNKCAATSMVLMAAAALAVVVGDNLANMSHRKRLKAIRDDWGKIVNPEAANGNKDLEREASIDAQSKAFEKLAEAEDSMAKAANLKKTIYLVASIAFGVAGAIAVFEAIPSKTATSLCPVASTTSGTPKTEYYAFNKSHFLLDHQFQYNLEQSNDLATFLINKQAMELTDRSPSIEEFEKLKVAFSYTNLEEPEVFKAIKEISLIALNNLIPIQNSHADSNAAQAFKEDEGKGFDWLGTGGGLAVGITLATVTKGKEKSVRKKLVHPIGRSIYAGVMVTLTAIMSDHSGKQAKASENRAEHLRKMAEEFKLAAGHIYACKSEDRNDPGKPSCYCYTPDNARNPSRSNSAVCAKLFGGGLADSSDYYKDGGGDRICITNTNQADPACACKKTKSCMKLGLSGLKGLNMNTMSLLGQGISPLNSFANGGSAASIDAGMSGNLAANINKLQQQLETNPALKDFAKNKDKNSKGLLQELIKGGSGIPSGNLLGSSGSSGMPTNAGEAARMLEKELEPEKPTTIGGSGTIATPSSDSPAMEFGLTEDQFAAQSNQVAEVMKENLDYGGNDINQGPNTNIFEVLSNRYQRSGMRRLFDEKGITTPDKSSGNEINP